MAHYFKPNIEWISLLRSAPYFSSAFIELTPEAEIQNLHPLAKAIYYYNLFDGEISNGGVMQYFFNQAHSLPDFDQADSFIEAHPALTQVMPIVREVHQAWDMVKDDVKAARETGEWPEELFSKYAGRFNELQKSFFAINHEVAQSINAQLIQSPQDYFNFLPLDGLMGHGIEIIELDQGKIRLRFDNGFPVGPNLFETTNGHCDLVWFNSSRDLLISENGFRENRFRHWIHYPSSISGQWMMKGSRLENYKSQKGLWNQHGIGCVFAQNGNIQQESIANHQQEILVNRYLDNGKLLMSEQKTAEGTLVHRYWPNGQLNTLSIRNEKFIEVYSQCFDEKGNSLINNGSGNFYQFLGLPEGRPAWREGKLVDGLLQGEVIWYWVDQAGNPQVTSKAKFVDGKQNVIK